MLDVLFISAPRRFGEGVRLWWSYAGRVRDVIAPDVRAARHAIADVVARLRRVDGAVHAVADERTGRVGP